MMEATRSSETSVLTRAKRRNIPGDDILHKRRPEKLKSYTFHKFVQIFKKRAAETYLKLREFTQCMCKIVAPLV
jgi:hypothetical protein